MSSLRVRVTHKSFFLLEMEFEMEVGKTYKRRGWIGVWTCEYQVERFDHLWFLLTSPNYTPILTLEHQSWTEVKEPRKTTTTYIAIIEYDGKLYSSGLYDTREDAAACFGRVDIVEFVYTEKDDAF